MQDFRRLLAWKRAHAFAQDARRATRLFPRTGYGDLKSQIIRAAESIPSNIAEGCAAATRTEFARFLDIALKSASEVDYRLELARDYGVLPDHVWQTLAREVVMLRKMLSALRRAVVTADRATQTPRKTQVTGFANSPTTPSVDAARRDDPGSGTDEPMTDDR
jgi:four helix bundle protein